MKPVARLEAARRNLLLRALVVVPVCAPPIRDGAVAICRGRIHAVGRWRELRGFSASTIDLGASALLPGLVNAHCHLDYTDMAGQIAPPKVFTDWLKLITETKAGWTQQDYAESWQRGAEMLLRTGTTTVGDIEAVPQLLPQAWGWSPLRVVSYLELIGITSRRAPELVMSEAREQLRRLSRRGRRVGLSPHAPYSTVPRLLEMAAGLARKRRSGLCVHAGESALEYEMFARGSGSMFEWLERSGRDMSDCGMGSPIEHLARSRVLSEKLILAHANYLGRHDARLLGEKGVHVVHCPRSHFYFKHAPFPYRSLVRAGVNVCLGTDSLASVYKSRGEKVVLDMFAEMRAFQSRFPKVAPRRILEMATVGGARALGFKGRVGELARGREADLIAIPMEGSTRSVFEVIVKHQGEVAASMIGGRWAMAPAAA